MGISNPFKALLQSTKEGVVKLSAPLRRKAVAKVLFAAAIFLTIPAGYVLAGLWDFDTFDRYGKHLPWVAGQEMLLTKTPNSHLATQGYYAQDFAKQGAPDASLGIPVHVISDGIVDRVDMGYNCGFCNTIRVDHQNGYLTRYSHLSVIFVNEGEPIRSGQEIGLIGATGNVTGANLEMALYKQCGTSWCTVKATSDGRPFEGYYDPEWDGVWNSPVDNFDKPLFTKFNSENETRPDDPDNPWDPPVIDVLDRYLEKYGYLFPSGMIAEPVNTYTGAFLHRNIDLELASNVGPELKYERNYNSPDNFNSYNGEGWMTSFNSRVMAHEEQQYSVKLDDGHGEVFQETDSDPDTFTATFNNITPEGTSTLERLGAEDEYRFKFTMADGTVYIFNSDKEAPTWGKVESITDKEGWSLEFEYDEEGLLSKVTDSWDRYITFEFGDDDKLDSISDSAGRTVSYAYNFDGRLETVTKANAGEWNYAYDSEGQITEINDGADKVFVKNTYEDGKVVSQEDGQGGITTFEYGKEKNLLGIETGRDLTKITDPRGNTVSQIHNDKGYMESEIAPNGDESKYEYNDKGMKTKETLPEGQIFTYEYDDNNNLTKEHRPNGYEKVSEYNDFGGPTKITDQSGVITIQYDGDGRMTKYTDQLGNETKYEYTSGLLSKKTDAKDHSLVYEYGVGGLTTSEENIATGAVLTYGYNAQGDRNEITDANNNKTTVEFNTMSNPTKVTDPKGNIAQYEYDLNGNLIKQIDERGAITLYEADGDENITKITYPNGSTETFEYDQNNNRTKMVGRNGAITLFEYDVKNRLTKVTYQDSDGNTLTSAKYEYNKNDWKTKEFDGKNSVTSYEYDSVGNFKKITRPDNASQHYTYDELSHLVAQTDYEGHNYKAEFDAIGQKTKVIDPLNNETKYSYDKVGNQLTVTDKEGNTTTNSYDEGDRLVKVKNAKNDIATYEYDIAGNLLSQTNFAGEKTSYTYDKNGNLATLTDPAGNVQTYKYDAKDKMSTLIDPRSNETKIAYNNLDLKDTETNALGDSAKYEYDLQGNLIKYTGENGASVSYKYDALNRKIEETDALGNKTKYKYDENSNLVEETDRRGKVYKYEYDVLNRAVKAIDPLNQEEEYKYSVNGLLVESIDKADQSIKFEYDELGRVKKETDQRGLSMYTTYDKMGRALTKTDFKGKVFNYKYDELGNMIEYTDRMGNKTTITYDAASRITSINKPLGVTAKNEYDIAGRLSKETNPEGGVTTYTYDEASNVKTVKNPRGFVTTNVYDALNRKVKTIDALNGETITVLDKVGRPEEVIDANGNSTKYAFDAGNNLIAEIDAKGNTKSFKYDAAGNMTEFTNARGFVTTIKYDELNREELTTYANSSTSSKKYDSLDRVVEIKDANGNTSSMQYDPVGNMIAQIDPLGFKSELKYDENANVIEAKDKAGSITTYAYDINDRVQLITNPLGGKKEFEYDALDRMISEKNERNAVTKFAYDKLGAVKELTDALNNVTKSEYDLMGNLIKQTNARTYETQFKYDALNRVETQTDAKGGIKSFDYDKTGNIVAVTDEEGNTTSYKFDAVYNLAKETNALGYATSYTYDQNNNLKTQTDANSHTTKYNYNSVDEQIEKIIPGGEKYASKYDLNGNKTEQILPKGNTFKYKYNARNELLVQTDPLGATQKFEYDALGRVTKETNQLDKSSLYNYDALSRLTKVTDAIGAESKYEYDPVGNLTKEVNALNKGTSYEYDLLNRKTKETNALGKIWAYKYDSVGNMIEEVDAKSQVTKNVYDELNRLSKEDFVNNAEDVSYNYDKVGNALKVIKSNITLNYSFDDIYQITEASDSRGYVTGYTFDPVGNTTDIKYPDNRHAVYAYNPNDLVSSLTIKYSGDAVIEDTPMTLTSTFEYDPNSNLVKQTNPNATVINTKYDNVDRLTQIEHLNTVNYPPTDNLLARYTYQLNAAGDKVKETILGNIVQYGECENLTNNGMDGHQYGDCLRKKDQEILAVVKAYQYDDVRRLTKSDEKVSVAGTFTDLQTLLLQDFSYDKVGNRTKQVSRNILGVTETTNYTYNDINSVTEETKYNYTYDANGNRTAKDSKDGKMKYAYKYDTTDQVSNVTSTEIIDKFNTVTLNFDYQYDGLGRRSAKINKSEYRGICPGNSDWKDTTNDCNNGINQGTDPEKMNPSVTLPDYYGIKKVDYIYNGQSWESLSEYFDRIEVPDKILTGPGASAKNDPVNNPNSVTKDDYFDLHTNYYKFGADIIASGDYAHMPIPALDICPGAEKVIKDADPDCNNGTGNNGNFDMNPKSWHLEPLANERVTYFHSDGLGSIIGQSNLHIKYKVTEGVVDPTPLVQRATLPYINGFEAYGLIKPQVSNPKYKTINYNERTHPRAFGFSDWNNKTYSGKELDIESDSYYYGARFYDPANGVFNRQDSYRGESRDPMTRHRYMFVNDNPTNNIDLYGFGTCGVDMSCQSPTTYKQGMDNLVTEKREWFKTQNTSAEEGKVYHQGEATRLSGLLPGLQSKMQAAWWGAYNAKVSYHERIVQAGMVGRLMARGYAMDYNAVGQFVNTKIQETGQVYVVKQTQYVSAANRYYGTVAQRDYHVGMVTKLTEYIGFLATESVAFEDWVGKVNTTYSKTNTYGRNVFDKTLNASIEYQSEVNNFNNDNGVNGELLTGFNRFLGDRFNNSNDAQTFFQSYFKEGITDGFKAAEQDWKTEQIKLQAEAEKKQALLKIVVGSALVIGGVACAIATVGVGAAACAVGAVAIGAAVLNEGVNYADASYTADTGVQVDTKADILTGLGMDRDTAMNWSEGIDIASDISFAVGATLVTGGSMLAIALPAGVTATEFTVALMATNTLQAYAIGAVTLTAGNYLMLGCANSIGTNSECGVFDYATNVATMFSGAALMAGATSSVSTFLTQPVQDPTYHRPYIRDGVRTEVEEAAPKNSSGQYIDPNTKQPIQGSYDLGHKPGYEYWRLERYAAENNLTQQELNNLVNNSKLYQIESPLVNQSHIFESTAPYNPNFLDAILKGVN